MRSEKSLPNHKLNGEQNDNRLALQIDSAARACVRDPKMSDPDASMHAILTQILDGQTEELLQFVSEFVQVPSVTGEEGACAEFVERWFVQNGFDVERHYCSQEDLDRWPEYAAESQLSSRPNIIGHLKSARPTQPDVVINGHIDVVPVGSEELWQYPPFGGVRDGGRIYGRGTADMKAGLAAALFGIRALREAGFELPFNVQAQCVVAEESGGLGTLSMLHSRAQDISAALVLEPTSSNIVSAGGGAIPFTISTVGRAAHISIPWTGVDAFDQLLRVIRSLRDLETEKAAQLAHPLFDRLPAKAALAIGVVEAGEWRLTVPPSARLLGRIGMLPFEEVEDVRSQLRAALERASEGDDWMTTHPPVISWDGAGFAGWETPADDPLISSLVASAKELGGPTELECATFGSDAGKFASLGFPVALFGPGDLDQAHCKDESVEEEDVVYASKVVAATLARLATGVTA